MAITTKDMVEAARKSGVWFAGRQTEKGNYIGNEKPDKKGNYSDTDDLGCYYKSIYFLKTEPHRLGEEEFSFYFAVDRT